MHICEGMTDLGCLLIGLLLLLGHRFLCGSCFLLICCDAHHHGLHINRSLLQHRLQLAELTLQTSGHPLTDEDAVPALPMHVGWRPCGTAAAARAACSKQLLLHNTGLRPSA